MKKIKSILWHCQSIGFSSMVIAHVRHKKRMYTKSMILIIKLKRKKRSKKLKMNLRKMKRLKKEERFSPKTFKIKIEIRFKSSSKIKIYAHFTVMPSGFTPDLATCSILQIIKVGE
jgi:hypothetical protein